jgi:NAD(P)-dependent dehydrogenase (short-subunit alcohol dehydrogenase family)
LRDSGASEKNLASSGDDSWTTKSSSDGHDEWLFLTKGPRYISVAFPNCLVAASGERCENLCLTAAATHRIADISMDSQLRGKNALITGGSSGIGLAIAHALANEGANVAVASRSGIRHAEESLRAAGAQVCGIQADVSREEDVTRMVREAISQLGGIDLYVNNAAQAQHQPITKIDVASYRAVLDTNLSACLFACREVTRHMISRGNGGAMLLVGSTSMYTPGPTEAVYRITKYGLKSLNENLAIELAPHGIRVNLLVPGHYRTRLTEGIPREIEERLKQQIPLRRFGDTADCGAAAAFLLSPTLAAYITGAELVVDGGLSLRPLYFGTDDELKDLNKTNECDL